MSRLKRPLFDVVWKLEDRGSKAQVSCSSLDHSSKLQGPYSPRAALQCDVNITLILSLILSHDEISRAPQFEKLWSSHNGIDMSLPPPDYTKEEREIIRPAVLKLAIGMDPFVYQPDITDHQDFEHHPPRLLTHV
ncbi:hypothetical protein TNCV_4243401 [Trichonephila clavipes]|nr:hypothetical protein TNCV_4243401 [Trichonephila clavipes]